MGAVFLILLVLGLTSHVLCEKLDAASDQWPLEDDVEGSQVPQSKSEPDEAFQNKVHNSLERKRLSRFHRGLTSAVEQQTSKDFFHEYSVSRAVNYDGLLPKSTLSNSVFDIFRLNGKLHVVAASRTGGLQLYRFERRFERLFEDHTNLPIEKVQHFIRNGQLWLACLHLDGGEHVIRTYEWTNRLVIRQTIQLDALGDFELGISDDDIFLGVIQIKRDIGSAITNEGEFRLYQWRQTSFTRKVIHEIVGATALQLFAEEDSGPLFIAIAQSSDQSSRTESIFLLYNKIQPKKLRTLQRIQLFKPTQILQYSSFGYLYVAFVTQTGVTLFWFDGMQFIEWQTLPSSKSAESVQWMRMPNYEVALLVLQNGRVISYTQDADGKYGSPTAVSSELTQEKIFGFRLFNLETVGDICLIESAVYTPSYRLHLQKVLLKPERETDPLRRCLNALEAKILQAEEIVNEVDAKSKQVWQYGDLIDRTLVIHGTLEARGEPLRAQSLTLRVDNTQEPYALPRRSRQVPQEEDILKLGKKASSLTEYTRSLERELALVARSDVPQTWNGTYEFTKPITVKQLRVRNSEIARINSVSMSAVLHDVVRTDRDQVFHRPLSVQGEIHADELRTKFVNEIDFTDLLLKHKRQTVIGHKTFERAVFNKGLDTPTINGLPLSQIAMSDSEGRISGVKKFARLNVVSDLRLHEFNGRNFEEFLNSAVDIASGKPIHINGNWDFPMGFSADDLRLHRPISNKFDITHMRESAMTLNTPQNISAHFEFSNPVKVEGRASARTVNRIDLTRDLVTLNTPQTIQSHITIAAPIRMTNAEVDRLNGIPVSDFVLTTSKRPQVVSGRKTFLKEIQVVKGIQMGENVKLGGVDPSEVVKGKGPALNVHEPFRLRSLTISGSVQLMKGFNDGLNLRILKDTVWMRNAPQVIRTPIEIPGEVRFMLPIEPATVNGYSLKDDLIHNSGNQLITVEKLLTVDRVDCRTLHTTATLINGMDLANTVQNIVTTSGEVQDVSSPVEFSDVAFETLDASSVNKYKLSEFARKQSGDLIRGLVILDGPVSFEHLHVNEKLSVGVLNNQNLAEYLNELVFQHNAHTKPIRNKSFINGLTFGNLITANSTLNGIRFPSVLSGFALKDHDQVFKGRVVLKNSASAPLLEIGRFGGNDFTSRLKNVVLNNKPNQDVTGTKTFEGPVIIDDLFTQHVNGINLKNFLTNAMKKSGSQNVFTGPVHFAEGFETIHLTVKRDISGVDLKKMIPITSEKNNNFRGDRKFKRILVGEDLRVSGLVNGVNVTRLNTDALRSFSIVPQIIRDSVRFRSLHCDRGVRLTKANGIMMTDFIGVLKDTSLGNIVHKGSLVVPHPIEVGFLVHKQKFTGGGLNDIHLDKILDDAVYTNTNQVIAAPKVVKELRVARITVEKGSQMIVTGQLNGLNPNELATLVHSRNRVITAPKTFKALRASKVILNGPINGISLQRDLILSENTEIRTPVRTQSLRIGRGLHIDNVNGHSVSRFLRNHNSQDTFDGTIRIKVPSIRVDALDAMRVNGIDLRDFVFVDEERPFISGMKTFTGAVIVEGDIADSQNEFSAILRTVACPDSSEVPGSLRFTGPVTAPAVYAKELYGLSQPRADEEALLREATRKARELESQMTVLQDTKYQIDENIRRIRPTFEEFVEVQKISTGRSPVAALSTAPSDTSSTISAPRVRAKSLILHVPRDINCPRGVCCSPLDTLTYTFDARGVPRGVHQEISNRRIFDLSDALERGFSVVTNTSSTSIACAPTLAETTEVFQMAPSIKSERFRPGFPAFSNWESAYLKDAKSFSFRGRDFILLVRGFSKYGTSRPGLQVLERTPEGSLRNLMSEFLEDIVAIDVISTSEIVFIAAATHGSARGERASKIYQMYQNARGKLELAAETVLTQHATDVKLMAIQHDGTLLCVFANEHSILRGRSAYTEPVSVLRYDPTAKSFSEIRPIPVYGATSLAKFSYMGQDFLAIASPKEGTLSVWQWVGYPEFVQIVTMEVPIRHIHAYWSAEEGGLMLAASDDTGSVRILRALWSGFCPKMFQYSRYQQLHLANSSHEPMAWINHDIRSHNQARYWPKNVRQREPRDPSGEGVREDPAVDPTPDPPMGPPVNANQGNVVNPDEKVQLQSRERDHLANSLLPLDNNVPQDAQTSNRRILVNPMKRYVIRPRSRLAEKQSPTSSVLGDHSGGHRTSK